MSGKTSIESLNRSILFRSKLKTLILCIAIYGFAFFYFFPIFYMFLSGFKTEYQAVNPSLFFTPTLETYAKVLGDRQLYGYLWNSCFQVLLGTGFSLLLGLPAAFVLVFGSFKKQNTKESVYSWFVTTILLPPVAVLIPLYTWFQMIHLNKTPFGLLLAYVGFHIPLVVWMLYSFISDVPYEVLEAAEIDGCTRVQQLIKIVFPLIRSGVLTTGLLVAVFIWNEFFLGFNLTGNDTATLPVFMARFREQQGMFVAQLSASSTIAVLPALIVGWITQKSLVKGLMMGAVKG